MVWSFIIWVGLVVGGLVLGFAYLNARLIGTAGLSRRRKKQVRMGLTVMFVLPVLSMFLFRYLESWPGLWAWVVYLTLGFLLLLLLVTIFRDIIILGVKGYDLMAPLLSSGRVAVDPSRRQFLVQSSNVAVLGVAGLVTTYGVYEARRRPGIVELRIPIQRLPEAFEGFRIVQLTDIHAGLTVKRDWIEAVARQVDELKPDLIAFTGDLVDGSVPYLRDHVAPLAELSAPSGKFFVTGNHEYYSGALPWVKEIERMGYHALLNSYQLIERKGSSVVLAGVTDYTGGDFHADHVSDPAKAVADAPGGMAKILLAHQPRTLLEALPLGFDLQISGHTHGGQFFPGNLLATVGQPYIAGLHRRENTWVYVSRGTGYWGPPIRLGVRSEVTVFTLTSQADGTTGTTPREKVSSARSRLEHCSPC